MFAATTGDALSVSDPAILKKAPSSIPSCLDLIETPTASSWSPDNAFLYISSAKTIHRYEPISNALKDVYSHGLGTISHLVSRDKDNVIFTCEDKIHFLDCDPNSQISQTFESHKASINSLSLSNDLTLLASTSAGAAHVHNISLGSHTVLRGLPNQGINTSTFHPHSRTRLLVAAGKHLMVYDTTRPSGPIKNIAMSESSTGDITAVACSPFSKTLVVVATSTGFVGLVDLEKEKALFRTLNLKYPLTSLGFSPEGAAIYFGTATGKLLLVDLRALDKPPKTITLSVNGSRVQTISVQKKAKTTIDGPTKTPVGASAAIIRKPSAPSEPLPTTRRAINNAPAKPTSKTAPSPARPRAATGGAAASPASRRVPSSVKEGGPASTPLKRPISKEAKNVLSPVRDPLGNSGSAGDVAGQLDELSNRRRGKTTTTPVKVSRKLSTDSLRPRPSPSPRGNTDNAVKISSRTTEAENARRARTMPTSTSTSTISSRKASTASITTSASTGDRLAVPRSSPLPRDRVISSASRAGSGSISALSTQSNRTTKGITATTTSASHASRPSSSVSRQGSPPTSVATRNSSPARSRPTVLSRAALSRTPSPDLPDMGHEPVTPIPGQKQKAMAVLGLGTPEVDRWIQAGKENDRKKRGKDLKGKGKTVGFQDDEEDSDNSEFHDDEDEASKERQRDLSMQISPRRPIPGVSASGSGSTDSWAADSPLNLSSHTGASPGGGGTSAHELLKTIVQDVMFDFQRETKAEMMGLHLDLLRMGRGWKTELRTLMDEYVGDLRDLRDENQRLRLENERLKRGY
ncbi:hypothetical protein GALMADRAFT_142169 [Galerina marginata CBS 339.88]|uniref:Uncharacterized protein n=1 Tax=Galerina marginata (strain CBS 339.88) TaxID=685588 RepID=A0A067T3W0_GALM3|nr:hypothetical protein GALMADRAFT_142169 [Galerina marginata CBS 339.88]